MKHLLIFSLSIFIFFSQEIGASTTGDVEETENSFRAVEEALDLSDGFLEEYFRNPFPKEEEAEDSFHVINAEFKEQGLPEIGTYFSDIFQATFLSSSTCYVEKNHLLEKVEENLQLDSGYLRKYFSGPFLAETEGAEEFFRTVEYELLLEGFGKVDDYFSDTFGKTLPKRDSLEELLRFKPMDERHFVEDGKLSDLNDCEHIRRIQYLGCGDPKDLSEDEKNFQEELTDRYGRLLSAKGRKEKRSAPFVWAAVWAERASELTDDGAELYIDEAKNYLKRAALYGNSYKDDPYEFFYHAYALRYLENLEEDIDAKIVLLGQLEVMVEEIMGLSFSLCK